MVEKESLVAISITLVIAVALFAGGGYMSGGFTVAFDRASVISGLIMFAVGVYFAMVRFLRNHVNTLLLTAVMLFREPKIYEKSFEEIERSGKDLKRSLEIIRKVLH